MLLSLGGLCCACCCWLGGVVGVDGVAGSDMVLLLLAFFCNGGLPRFTFFTGYKTRMSPCCSPVYYADKLTRLSSLSIFLFDVGVLAAGVDEGVNATDGAAAAGVGCGGGGKRCCSCDTAIDDDNEWSFS